MDNMKGSSEAGSGGKCGHSNMEHWVYSEEHKETGRLRRRLKKKREVRSALQEQAPPAQAATLKLRSPAGQAPSLHPWARRRGTRSCQLRRS